MRFAIDVQLEDVNARGTALSGIVSALTPTYQKAPDKLPRALWRYFQDPIAPDRWYSLAAYVSLMKILAAGIDPAKAKGDVYRAFGVIGAQRDLRGVQDNVPEEQRPEHVGLYRDQLDSKLGLSARVRRGLNLRERYYSRGYYRVKRTAERALTATLHEFPASAELCSVSTGYLVEVFRSPELGAWTERVSCRGLGDADCRWELRFGDEVDVSSLADFG